MDVLQTIYHVCDLKTFRLWRVVAEKAVEMCCAFPTLSYFGTPTSVLYFAEAARARSVTFGSNGGSNLAD